MRRILALLAAAAASLHAAEFRILPAGELPHDHRLGPPKDYDGYFPFSPPPTQQEWETRATLLRQQIRVALGIWPEPERTPLNAVIHGRMYLDDYSVEKVSFESMPGFYVTGNLYRPTPVKTAANGTLKFPAILNPHGHWPEGRFMSASDKEVHERLASGAERFDSAARSHLQARPVQLARMGCIVFHYDMIGYADSAQISLSLAHGFARQRPEMNTAENWGFFSARAEAEAQSIMGLQIWNGVRALDFLLSLPDVDPARIGMTGASGGGTQTMLLSAIDPRISVECPAVMVSTAMQGGCTCENASLLRVDTGNIEFAALFAPKPLAMTAANDWTKEMPSKGYPDLQKHWAMMGAPGKVSLTALLQFPHNYNSPSRAAMDRWFNQHLHLELSDEALAERNFRLLSRDEMTVWDAAHPAPEGGEEFERKLVRWWHDDAQKQILRDPKNFEKVARPAIQAIIGRSAARKDEVEWIGKGSHDHGQFLAEAGLVRNLLHDEELPALILKPHHWTGTMALWLDPRGKDGLFSEGAPTSEVRALLAEGTCVIGVDLFDQGEFLHEGETEKVRRVANPREAGAYTYGYNPSVFAERVRDILTVIGFSQHFLEKTEDPGKDGSSGKARIVIFASGKTGPVASAACAIAGGAISAAVLETAGFRFANVSDLWSTEFLLAGAKYGDLPGMLALISPQPVFLLGEREVPAIMQAAYEDANAPKSIQIGGTEERGRALDWLKETNWQSVTP